MAREFSRASVLDRAVDDTALFTSFTAFGRNALLDAANLMLLRWRWQVMTDAEWDETEAAITKAIEALMTNTEIGTIKWRAGGIQANELLCDGSTYARVDYPDLYDVLDTAYIVDANNFTVPDLVRRTIVGEGSGWNVGDTGGAEEHTLTEAEIPAHTHSYTTPTFNIDVESVGVPDPTGVGNPQLPATTGSTGGGQAHNNMPPYHVLTPVIVAL